MKPKDHQPNTDTPDTTFVTHRESAETVEAAAATRRSIRAYLPRQVERSILKRILEIAGKAPSGSNFQPWKVYVLSGKTLSKVSDDMRAAYLQGRPNEREYKYYPSSIPEPFLSRRRTTGWGLYNLLGITRGDMEKSREFRVNMYGFFGAPVGIVFSIDKKLELGSWLDYGMFLQTLMLAARQFGLDSCPQASIAEYPSVLRSILPISDDEIIVCGMALGYAKPDSIINTYQPDRLGVNDFSAFFE